MSGRLQMTWRWGFLILLVAGACAEAGVGSGEPATANAESCTPVGVAVSVGGLAPPEHIFGEIPDVSMLPDSGFAAVDRQAREVHLFGADGLFIKALGGEGEGPGEFLDPIAVDVVDGRVLVWDWRQSRVTAFDLTTGGVETFAVPGQLNPTHQFGATTNGFMIGATTGVLFGDEGEFWTLDLGVVSLDLPSGSLDTLFHVPDRIVGWVNQAQRRTGSPHFSPRADVTTSGGLIFFSRGDSAVVIRRGSDRLDTLRWDWTIRAVTTDDIEAYRELWKSQIPETRHADINRLFEVMPAAETFPVVKEILPDRDGGIWVQVYAEPLDSARTWLRLEEDVVCQIELPRAFIAKEGGRTWLLGVSSDEFGVERVERWTIQPAQF